MLNMRTSGLIVNVLSERFIDGTLLTNLLIVYIHQKGKLL